MSAGSFRQLREHVGHDLVCVVYRKRGYEDNVAVECNTCNEVLLDFNKHDDHPLDFSKSKKNPYTKRVKNQQPLRLEGVNVHRVGSRGYPEQGGELRVTAIAGRFNRDGSETMTRIFENQKVDVTDRQSIEEHVARTAFMHIWQIVLGRADALVQAANKKEAVNERRKKGCSPTKRPTRKS